MARNTTSQETDKPYPMDQPHLGHSVIVNNLASEIPDSVSDVQDLSQTYSEMGFKVKVYNDCNIQRMRQIKDWIMASEYHTQTNSFFLTIICREIEQGWLPDRYKRRTYKLDQLVAGLCAVSTLQGKPKVIIIQQYTEEGKPEELRVSPKIEDMFILSATYHEYSGEPMDQTFLKELASVLSDQHKKEPFRKIIDTVRRNVTVPVQAEQLSDTLLGRLAPKISSMTMRNLAVQRLGFTEDQIVTLVDECRENKQSLNRQILIKWKNKTSNASPQVLAGILRQAARDDGQVDFNQVAKVLNVNEMKDLQIKVFDTLTRQLLFSEFYNTSEPPAAETQVFHSPVSSGVSTEASGATKSEMSKDELISQMAAQMEEMQEKLRRLEMEMQEKN